MNGFKEVTKEIRQYFKWNENEAYQNVWDVANLVLTVKFMVLNIYIRKKNDLESII